MRIVLEGVAKSYASRVVLGDVDLVVESPCLLAVTGPSGSGKTTLLGVLAGLVEPSAGTRSVELAGGDTELRLAWVLQSSPILGRRSALDNVALGPLTRGSSRPAAEVRALDAMGHLGLGALARTAAYRLSGGERQRLVVARALATDAHLLIADEPTASLDPVNRALVCEALATARDEGCAVLVATHDPVVADRCEGRVDISRSDVDAGAE